MHQEVLGLCYSYDYIRRLAEGAIASTNAIDRAPRAEINKLPGYVACFFPTKIEHAQELNVWGQAWYTSSTPRNFGGQKFDQ